MPSMVEARLNKIEGLLRVLLTRTQIWLAGASGAIYYNGGNVGIGTTSPTQMLSVGASNQFSVSSTGGVLATDYSGGQAYISTYYGRASSVDTNIGSLNNHNIVLTPNGTGNIQMSGKVGIGTTSPGQKFQVNADIADWVSLLNNANAGGYGLLLDADVEILRLRTAAGANRHRFLTNGDVYLDLVGGTDPTLSIISHKVGIGNNNPQDVLDVTGDIRCSGKFSSAGTDGITGTLTTADLVGKTLTFTNGIITGYA